MRATFVATTLLCLTLTGGRRVEKPQRSPAEESKRLYLQQVFGEEGDANARKGSSSTVFAAQQGFTYARSGGGGRNIHEFAPKRSKLRKNGGLGAVAAGMGIGGFEQTTTQQLPRERKPNIVLILTDDQDVELGSLNFMPRTQRLLRDEGAEFRHAYVTTPMCCPSRSSLLTGMLVHNHQVFTNNDNCSGNAWQATHETRSFATYLSNAGYRTGYFGKYLNKYNGSYIPPGWREWAGLIMNSRYYNYSINVNGKRIKHGDDYHRDYYPDLIANDSVAFLRHSKQSFSRKPVMLVMSFPAPHGPEDSAPQYSHLFFNVTTHHTPAYDYAPNPDKQWILRVTNRMQPIHKRFTDLLMTKRLQTLQSVDAAVQKVYNALQELGELDNTYIVYTSDHGYHLGQFGLVKGKSFPFEFDIRVPFLVRGPGVEPGTIVDDIVLNVDLAPTFLDVAGVDPPSHMDGRSLLPLLHRGHKQPRRRRSRWPDTFLVESSGRREIPPPSVDNQVTGEHQGNSKVARLNRECLLPTLQHPCQPGQKWTCVKEEGRWRKHKCKFVKPPPLSPPEVGWSTMYKAQMGRRRCTCFPPHLAVPAVMPSHTLIARQDQEERKMQRNYLRTQLAASRRDAFKPGFIKPSRRRRSIGDLALSLVTPVATRGHAKRVRRSLTALLDSLLGGVSQQLFELQQQINDTSDSNAAFTAAQNVSVSPDVLSNPANVSSTAKCRVVGSGQVNCSRAVYRDSRVWRRSKQHVDLQISKLRDQLEALKEIRRHLRNKRPPAGTHDDPGSSEEEEDASSEDDDLDISEDDDDDDIDHDTEGEEEYPDVTSVPHHEVTSDLMFTTAGPLTTQGYQPSLSYSRRPTSPRPTIEDIISTTAIPMTTPRGRHHSAKLGTTVHRDKQGNVCICEPDPILEARRKQKELRLKRKERKMRRKARMEQECLSEKMNCFTHDNSHWRTAPLWTEGPFCVCMNANNNTYSCLRTINATHNYLFCEFTTGLVTFYNLRIDPFEQWNRAHALSTSELLSLRTQLAHLKGCRGARECRSSTPPPGQPSSLEQESPQPVELNRRRNKSGSRQHGIERIRHRQDHTFEPQF